MEIAAGTQHPPSIADVLRRFECNLCGNCCRGVGHVFLEEPDIRRLAAFFNLSVDEFRKRYTRTIESGNVVLIDQNDADQSCVFLRGNECSVHEAKPRQCQGFPHRWRTPSIEAYCEGWRAALGLPPLGHKAKHEG